MKWRWILAALLVAIALDFNGFRTAVADLRDGEALEGDAIVVLTGGSGLRISEAMRRLGLGEGERLLISGVNPSISMEQVADRTGGDPGLYDCCVDVGYEAMTTRGNAHEVAAWARDHGYGRLILVTSDYHLPRSMLLLQDAAPDLVFVAAPAKTRIDAAQTFSDWRSFRGMVTEWAKWRVTQLELLIT